MWHFHKPELQRCGITWHNDQVTEAVSLEQLRDAARQKDAIQDELVRLVRLANRNGIPKTKIADAIGMSRETVSRYCAGGER